MTREGDDGRPSGVRQNGVMQLFAPRLPADAAASLAEHLGRRPRVLAWGRSDAGPVVALHERLAVLQADGWADVPWHDVLGGGWDDEARSLHWVRLSTGERVDLPLAEPGSLPEVFRERVESTFLFQQVLQLAPGKSLTITARRNLVRPEAPVLWTVHPGRGVQLDDPDTRAFAEAELGRLRAEYAF